MSEPPTSWKRLFSEPPGNTVEAVEREMVVLKKRGEPLLVLPRGAPATVEALGLYPAQTWRARLAKRVWSRTLRWRMAPGAGRDWVTFDPEDAFVRFLKAVAEGGAGRQSAEDKCQREQIPLFALLAGNPHAPGRRFLLLVFDAGGRPVAVVKAGADKRAGELIEKESSFLASPCAKRLGIPTLRQTFRHGEICAFALDYIEGESPRPDQMEGIVPILNSWLEGGKMARVEEVGGWQRLAQASGGDELFCRIAGRLRQLPVRTAVFHGDLAPWNIKISPAGAWTVLDWERGEWSGLPGWDWFHYVIQPAVLVQRQSGAELAGTVERLLESAPLRAYAQAAGIAGHEREWLLAYLLHCRDVLRPAEGSPRINELLHLLSAQWRLEQV